MAKKWLLNYTLGELEQEFTPKFRAKQVYNWVYKNYVSTFSQMTNLPKSFVANLLENYCLQSLVCLKKERSEDGSIKYLFELHDGHTIEAVLLLMKEKEYEENGNIKRTEQYSVCVSTQVGCKVGCTFCLTAKGGFVRNLLPAEIVEQVLFIKSDHGIDPQKALNIVYMGMGEPLDNFDNLIQAIHIFSQDQGLHISPRRQTISTSGVSNKIEKLADLDMGVQLAISLHAVDDALRSELIPMNKAYNISSIIEALKKYPVDTRKKIMFEYLVIKDVNDGVDSANKLLRLLEGIKSKVNLIYFNPYPGSPYKRPTRNNMLKFQQYLNDRGLTCTVRESKGLDISAACGQLREQNTKDI